MQPFTHRLRVHQRSLQLFHSKMLPSDAKEEKREIENTQNASVSAETTGGKICHLTELGEVDLERLRVVFKAERDHRVQYVLASYRLALLELALLRRLGRDEADEFRHALLHALLGVLRDFGGGWDRIFHDARHVCDLRRPPQG
jgi:hypothetical protein